tara:strand:+ start:2469 stop:2579 length:111 start_codon:yes stop_codon:yes gene_type:complete
MATYGGGMKRKFKGGKGKKRGKMTGRKMLKKGRKKR